MERYARLVAILRTFSLLPLLLIGSILPAVSPTLAAQEDPAFTSEQLAEMASELRHHYYERAWELGWFKGEEWNERAPDALEVRAWYALCLARDRQTDKAIEVAEDLLERAPEDAWSWFAFAGSVFRHTDRWEEAGEPSEKALALRPDDLDFLSLRADVLRYVEGEEEAIAFVDSLPPGQGGHPLLQVRKAVAMNAVANESDDEALKEEAYQLFRDLTEMDPGFVEPPFFLGSRLQGERRHEEALPVLRRSAEISVSATVHEYLWRGLQAQVDKPVEEKLREVEADIEALLERRRETPGLLMAIARVYDGVEDDEKRDAIYDRVLVGHPDSPSAEWVLVNQYREMRSQMSETTRAGGEVDQEFKADYRRRLEEFLLRPVFHQERLRGDAYRNLLHELREEENVDPEFLYSVVRGVELYEGINTHIIHGLAPTILADNRAHLDYAEKLAREGFAKVEEEMEELKERGIFEADEEFDAVAGTAVSRMHDALGWVYFAQGRMDDAEAELLKGLRLSEGNLTLFKHLGELYEERHRLAQGEGQGDRDRGYLNQALDFYLKGSHVPMIGENPNDEALERLYESMHGSLKGFDEFIAEASATDSDSRKTKILSEELEEPRPMGPFALRTLDGEEVTSEGLAGKVAVINFWGAWCGPCIVELPGIQEFHHQYKGDDAVVFLTIANDRNPDVTRRLMDKEEYTFPVLMDQGYVSEQGVTAFPTTWFVDPHGKICFEKKGWSEELAQEFAWRVEALRGR